LSGGLHDADPLTPQPTLPAILLTGLSEHSLSGLSKRKLSSWLVTSVWESKGKMEILLLYLPFLLFLVPFLGRVEMTGEGVITSNSSPLVGEEGVFTLFS
jgi:hypothetical protein